MANILYLVHRLPYPPNKGDKLRSYHLLKHLSARHRVFLGTFIDDPDDAQHVGTVRALCADLHVARLQPRVAKLRSARGLVTGEALTLGYYRDAGLQRWVDRTAAAQRLDAAVVFSSSMAPYVRRLSASSGLPVLVDFVDVDSAKWTQYADALPAGLSSLPGRAIYRREGRRLLAFERAVAAASRRSFFATPQECALFAAQAPECAERIEAMGNGVDADYFSAAAGRVSPFAAGELPLVFTGAMDYWPNVDAVTWFAREVLPRLRITWPCLRLHVVGRAPTAAVRALATGAGSPSVSVSGTVPDVRPYLQHAAVVVAPLRVARGIQNKLLEAMSMGCAVVAESACAAAVGADTGVELRAAADGDAFVHEIDALLRAPGRRADLGAAARARVLRGFSWGAQLGRIDRHLAAPEAGALACHGAAVPAEALPAAAAAAGVTASRAGREVSA